MFSLARTPSGQATPAILDTAEKCIDAVVRKWKDLGLSMLGPKWHAVHKHLLFLMRKWLGIGCFTEDHIEQSHQTGMLEERRTGNMRCRERAAVTHSNEEWKRVLAPSVRSERSRVKSETTRTRREKRVGELSLREETESNKKKKRNDHRERVLNNVNMNAAVVDNVVVDDEDDDDDVDGVQTMYV
mmetsp:Transcript_37163/g.40299  ORF Transcript_37163/g.40299 Transcript_37163/m.40299 type:complete len:186 (-) Transcript_37163:186-743(-)